MNETEDSLMKIRNLALAGIIGTALATTIAAAPMAYADGFIAAGKDGWGYDRRATELVKQLRSGWDVANFNGSEDIARAVCASSGMTEAVVDNQPAQVDTAAIPVGIVQIDAMLQMSQEGCTLEALGIYPAQEYAFIMFPPDGYNELDDLGEGNSILVGEPGSGAALFWRTIVGIEKGENGNNSNWSKATPVYGPFSLANTKASMGQIDAAILVTSPDAKIIQDLLTEGWEIGELDDKDIDDFKFGRGSLYERSGIRVDHPNRYRDIRQDAIEVRSYWIANSKWLAENPTAMGRLSGLIAAIN